MFRYLCVSILVRQYGDGTVCGEVNAKNGFGGYAGFRPFVFNAGSLRFEADSVLCSESRNKPLVKAQMQLLEHIERCKFEVDEPAPSCEWARDSAALVRKLGGRPPPIPEPVAVLIRTYELWAGLCEGSADANGSRCLKAADAEAQIKARGVVYRTREQIRQEQFAKAHQAFNLWAPRCAAEEYGPTAASCRESDEAAARMKHLRGSDQAQ